MSAVDGSLSRVAESEQPEQFRVCVVECSYHHWLRPNCDQERLNSTKNVIAATKSGVSKPSVNEPVCVHYFCHHHSAREFL
jgi:hypothetical protein